MAKLKGYKVIGTCPAGKKDVGLATGCDELIVLQVQPCAPLLCISFCFFSPQLSLATHSHFYPQNGAHNHPRHPLRWLHHCGLHLMMMMVLMRVIVVVRMMADLALRMRRTAMIEAEMIVF